MYVSGFAYIDPILFPDTPPNIFWLSSIDATEPSIAEYVNFFIGSFGYESITTPHYVRCVQ